MTFGQTTDEPVILRVILTDSVNYTYELTD